MPIAAYIREQPDVVRRVFAEVPARVAALARALPARPPALALVGSGTSRHALMALEPFLARRLGCPSAVLSPMAFAAEPPAWMGPGALAVVLSQSGASTTSIEALAAARARGMATLAVTAEPSSPLAAAPGPVLVMPVGPETVGPKTKGYTGSLAALMALGLALAGQPTDPRALAEAAAAAERLRATDAAVRAWAASFATRYARAPHLMVLGQGCHLATAHEAALKIAEMAGIAGAAFDTEEALHGRFHALDATTPVFFLARDGDELALARGATATLAELGIPSHLVTIGAGEAASPSELRVAAAWTALPELDLLGAIVPFLWLAHELARLRGLAPERMRYPGLSGRLGIKTAGPGVPAAE